MMLKFIFVVKTKSDLTFVPKRSEFNQILTPNVNFVGVIWACKDQLGCTIVSGDYVWSVKRSLFVKNLGRSEITYLDDTFFSEKNVLGLEVPMSHFFWVNILHALKYLLHKLADLTDGNVFLILLALLNDLFQVSAAEFEYEVLRCLSLIIPGVVNVKQLDNILASAQFVEHLKFTTHKFTGLSRSLHCHSLVVRFIVSLKNVAYIDDEIFKRSEYRKNRSR